MAAWLSVKMVHLQWYLPCLDILLRSALEVAFLATRDLCEVDHVWRDEHPPADIGIGPCLPLLARISVFLTEVSVLLERHINPRESAKAVLVDGFLTEGALQRVTIRRVRGGSALEGNGKTGDVGGGVSLGLEDLHAASSREDILSQ